VCLNEVEETGGVIAFNQLSLDSTATSVSIGTSRLHTFEVSPTSLTFGNKVFSESKIQVRFDTSIRGVLLPAWLLEKMQEEFTKEVCSGVMMMMQVKGLCSSDALVNHGKNSTI
jgi:hypothetical protein